MALKDLVNIQKDDKNCINSSLDAKYQLLLTLAKVNIKCSSLLRVIKLRTYPKT